MLPSSGLIDFASSVFLNLHGDEYLLAESSLDVFLEYGDGTGKKVILGLHCTLNRINFLVSCPWNVSESQAAGNYLFHITMFLPYLYKNQMESKFASACLLSSVFTIASFDLPVSESHTWLILEICIIGAMIAIVSSAFVFYDRLTFLKSLYEMCCSNLFYSLFGSFQHVRLSQDDKEDAESSFGRKLGYELDAQGLELFDPIQHEVNALIVGTQEIDATNSIVSNDLP